MKVLLFLAEGFEDLEAVSILDVMGWTEYRDTLSGVEVVTTGFHTEIHGRFGLVVSPDIPVDEIDPADYSALAIPGGFHSHGFDEAYDDRLRALACTFHRQGSWIATFCVGILPVAEAGLLKYKKAVSYPYSRQHNNLLRLQKLGAIIKNTSVVVDDRIISCKGPGASLEVAYILLEALTGQANKEKVMHFMCFHENMTD